MAKKRKPRISKPGEHGGLVILAGSAALGAAVSPRPLDALVAGLALVLGYMARGPIERRARKFRPRAWDGRVTVGYGVALIAATIFLAMRDPIIAAAVGGAALAFPAVGTIVTRARMQRSGVVELVALTICGGLTGLVALAGECDADVALRVGLAMAVYGCATVGVVRSETRREEEPRWAAVAVAVLVLGGAGLAAVDRWLVVALGPRAVHALTRWLRPPEPIPIMQVAVRESVELAGFVLLLLLFG